MRVKTLTLVLPPTLVHSHRLLSALINFEHVQNFNDSWWELKLSLLFDRQLSCTLIDCRALSSTLNVFKISMIVDESSTLSLVWPPTLVHSHRLSSALINFERVQNFDDSWWEFKLSLSFDRQLSCTLIECRALSSTLNKFKFQWELIRVAHVYWASLVNSHGRSPSFGRAHESWTKWISHPNLVTRFFYTTLILVWSALIKDLRITGRNTTCKHDVHINLKSKNYFSLYICHIL